MCWTYFSWLLYGTGGTLADLEFNVTTNSTNPQTAAANPLRPQSGDEKEDVMLHI